MMDITMMEAVAGELENSGCSSTSTVDNDIGCNWSDWSPVVDWGPIISGDIVADDFHGLIESMMCDDDNEEFDGYGIPGSMIYEPWSTTTSDGTPTPPNEKIIKDSDGDNNDDKGLRLVHLLMAGAEALTGAHKSRDLARVILVRLKELVPPTAVGGTNIERLAAHFTDALQSLLDGSAGGPVGTRSAGSHRDDLYQPSDVLTAFQLLQDMSPYVKFGHFTANQAILEAVAGDRRVHIVDYDIMEGIQWASLMQALVSRKDGPPPPHLRITAVTRGGGGGGRKSMGTVQETGRRLVAFAASIGQPFSFAQCRLDSDEKFRPAAVKVVKGEAVIANCVLHPPHRATGSVASFLTGAAELGARRITLVEEEGEGGGGGFVARFMDELHRYSAVWDSLEAGFPMQGRARGLVERVILGPRIVGAVGRAFRRMEDLEGEKGWGDWMGSAGFGRMGISFFNHCQARLLLGLFHDGYRVEEDAPNKLVLSWKSRRLLSASVWSSPPSPAPVLTATATVGAVDGDKEDSDFFSLDCDVLLSSL